MNTQQIDLSALQRQSEQKRFSGDTREYLAGRCLLDALEFLRIDPKLSARFGQLTNAHAIRLCWQCVTKLDHQEVAVRLRSLIESAYTYILDGRKNGVPFYGDDFWDWAYILDAMLTVIEAVGNDNRRQALSSDLKTFYREVGEHLDDGLALGKSDEWFGPAVPTAAHRLLNRARPYLGAQPKLDERLAELKKLALTPIDQGTYLKRPLQPADYPQWHFGQVAAEFPYDAGHLEEVWDLDKIAKLTERTHQAYALARVLQGSTAVGASAANRRALTMLYGCQDKARPFGAGLVGDSVKASLNTLEALWPTLNDQDLDEVRLMLDSFLAALKELNRIGILVAIPRERAACISRFKADKATVNGTGSVVEVDHPDYRVVIVTGKALLEAADATRRLVSDYKVTSAVLVGIAGSLGQHVKSGKFVGPTIGDVVVGSGTAAYRIREKARDTLLDAPVPWQGSTWDILPTDPKLFSLAHRVGQDLSDSFRVYEGLIVTGNGIKDHPEEKKKVRSKWPGGKAVAEEGFPLALGCMQYHIPQIEIRGISDLAEGDKKKQKKNPAKERRAQELAAKNAARLAIGLVKSLSKTW